MDHLVGDHIGHPAKHHRRGFPRLDEQPVFSKEDRAPILHRAHRKIRDADKVQLGQGICQAEVIIQLGKACPHHFLGEADQRRVSRRRQNADAGPRYPFFLARELGHGQRDEVGRHARGFFERDGLLTFGRVLRLCLDLHVREDGKILRNDGGDAERSFEAGFVKTRKRPARIGRLELSEGVPFLPDPRLIQAFHLPVERTRKGQAQGGESHRQFPGELQHERLRNGIDGDFRDGLSGPFANDGRLKDV